MKGFENFKPDIEKLFRIVVIKLIRTKEVATVQLLILMSTHVSFQMYSFN